MTKNLDYEPSEDLDLADDYDYVSDSDLENDEVAEYATKANDPAVGNQDSNVTVGNHNELAHHGKVVALRGVSYLTSVGCHSRRYACILIEGLIAFRQS